METFNQFVEKYKYTVFSEEAFDYYGVINQYVVLTIFDTAMNKPIPFTGILFEEMNFGDIGIDHGVRIAFYRNGLRHRLDGPASIIYNLNYKDGPATDVAWFINGEHYDSTFIKNWYIENNIDYHNMSDEDRVVAEMKFGK